MADSHFNSAFRRPAVPSISPLARMDKPSQQRQIYCDVDHYLSGGHQICQCPPGVAEDPLTLSDYQEGEVLLLIHGGRCV